jgi:hypothetical protein
MRRRWSNASLHFEEQDGEAIHSSFCAAKWIAPCRLSSGAHPRDPLARNDGFGSWPAQSPLRQPADLLFPIKLMLPVQSLPQK